MSPKTTSRRPRRKTKTPTRTVRKRPTRKAARAPRRAPSPPPEPEVVALAGAPEPAATSIPDHEPERMELFDLLYRWLPGMSQDGVFAGPNWTGDLVGLELDPLELREDLEKRLSAEQKATFAERFRKAKDAEKE